MKKTLGITLFIAISSILIANAWEGDRVLFITKFIKTNYHFDGDFGISLEAESFSIDYFNIFRVYIYNSDNQFVDDISPRYQFTFNFDEKEINFFSRDIEIKNGAAIKKMYQTNAEKDELIKGIMVFLNEEKAVFPLSLSIHSESYERLYKMNNVTGRIVEVRLPVLDVHRNRISNLPLWKTIGENPILFKLSEATFRIYLREEYSMAWEFEFNEIASEGIGKKKIELSLDPISGQILSVSISHD